MPTIEQLVMLAEVSLLEAGGVKNWDWYSESLKEYGYEKSDDEIEDAENFLNALKNGGVDDWTWYDESRTGLAEYEEYLEALPSLDDAMDIYTWKEQWEAEKRAEAVEAEKLARAAAVAAAEAAKLEKRKPKGAAAERVFAHIVSRFGEERAGDIYALANEKGLWKRNTFPKEFDAAVKVIVKGVSSPIELARDELVTLILKSGKLDAFLNEIA